MDVTITFSSGASALPRPRHTREATPEPTPTAQVLGTCQSLTEHMRAWTTQLEGALAAGDTHLALALSAALGENNSYLAGLLDTVTRPPH